MFPAAAQAGKKKRRTGRIFTIGLAILTVATCVVLLFSLGSREKVDSLGTLSVSTTGGSFSRDGVTFSVTAGAEDETVQLSVAQVTRRERLPENVAYQSSLYRLEGYLEQLSGAIQITLPLPQEALKHPYNGIDELAGSLFIEIEEELFTPSGGVITVRRPLDTVINMEAGTVSAVLTLDQWGLEGNVPLLFAARELPLFTVQNERPQRVTDLVSFRVTRYKCFWYQATSPLGHFRAIFPSGVLRGNVEEILNELEKQKVKLELMGFSFSGRTAYPIDVHIEKMDNIGEYRGSKWAAQSGTLYLMQNNYFENDVQLHKRTGMWNEVVATAGHELLHLVQAFYDHRGSFKKNHPWFDQPLHWLDEATATWYEARALENPGYLSSNAKDNINFIHTPLFFPQSGQSQRHGYGASLFITYLTNRFSDQLPAQIYNKLRAQGQDWQFPGYALNDALRDHYYAESDEQWIRFLAAYLIAPGEVAPGLHTMKLLTKEAVLRARSRGQDYSFFFEANGDLKKHQVAVVEGKPAEGINPSLTLQFQLQNLTGDIFILSLADDRDTRAALGQGAGQVRIEVTNSGEAGVIVYAANNFRETTSIHPVAAEPWNFLASTGDDLGRHRGRSGASVNFSFAPGGWNEIVFIPFNYDSVNLSRQTTSVTIQIFYEPEDLCGLWVGTLTPEAVHYSGELSIGGYTYRAEADRSEIGKDMNFHLTIGRDDKGDYTVTSESLPPIREYRISGQDISISCDWRRSGEYVRFQGRLDPGQQTISGTFEGGHTGYGNMISGRWSVRKQE